MERSTTDRDVAHDLVAALDMYGGDFGGENVTVEEPWVDARGDVIVRLSNGHEYTLRVRRSA